MTLVCTLFTLRKVCKPMSAVRIKRIAPDPPVEETPQAQPMEENIQPLAESNASFVAETLCTQFPIPVPGPSAP